MCCAGGGSGGQAGGEEEGGNCTVWYNARVGSKTLWMMTLKCKREKEVWKKEGQVICPLLLPPGESASPLTCLS